MGKKTNSSISEQNWQRSLKRENGQCQGVKKGKQCRVGGSTRHQSIDSRNVLTNKLETCSNCQEQECKGTVINQRERRGTGQSSKNNKGNIIEIVKPRKCNIEKGKNLKRVLNSI